MAKRKKQQATAQQPVTFKERYHGPLITNPVVLPYIRVYPWISLPFTIFEYFSGGYGDHIGLIKIPFLICIIINIFSILFSFFKPLVYRFQSFTYILIALVTWTILMFLDFIGLMMFISDDTSFSGSKVYQSPLTLFYVIPIILIFLIACGVYAWYYLPKNHGKRWAINDVGGTKDKKKTFANNFWIAFAGVAIVPPLLTGYIQNAFGFIFAILFTLTLPAVIVDAVYAAIYVRKHPEEDLD